MTVTIGQPNERGMFAVVKQSYDTVGRGVGIFFVHESRDVSVVWTPGQRFDAKQFVNDGRTRAMAEIEPLRIDESEARSLRDALNRYFGDEPEQPVRDLRADLNHERGRVDKLTDSLVRIAESSLGTPR